MTARKDGPIPLDYHLSVSQFKRFYLCQSSYWLRYPMGMKEPSRASLALGTSVHKVAERYLTMPDWPFDWEEDRAHRIFKPGIEYLPAPSTVAVEHAISTPIEGLTLIGAVDWYSVYFDCAKCGKQSLLDKMSNDWVIKRCCQYGLLVLDIGDHKTSKDPAKWALNERKLREDIQMNVYAYALMDELGIKPDKIIYRHVTYRTTGLPYAVHTSALANPETIALTWKKLRNTVPKIIHLRKEKNADRVPVTPSSCSAYGGCSFLNICRGSPKVAQNRQLRKLLTPKDNKKEILNRMRGSEMSTADEVKARLLAKLNLVKEDKPEVKTTTEDSYHAPVPIESKELISTLDAMGGALPLAAVKSFVLKRYAIEWKSDKQSTESLRLSGFTVEDGAVSKRADYNPAVDGGESHSTKEAKEAKEAKKASKVKKPATPSPANEHLLDILLKSLALSDGGRIPKESGYSVCKDGWSGARFHNSRFTKVLELGKRLGQLTYDDDFISAAGTVPSTTAPVDAPPALPALPALPPKDKTPAEPAEPVAPTAEPAEPTSEPVDPELYAHQEGTPVTEHPALVCTILLGCFSCHSITGPTGAVNLDHWLKEPEKKVHKREGFDWIAEEYGKGRRAVASQVLADLRTGELKLPSVLYVPRNHILWPELSVIFAALPVLVIRPG